MDLFTYLMAKKGHNTHRDLFSYLLGKKSQLPSEYQRLEYIESTGTQYIDSNVNLTQNSSIELSVSINVKNTQNKMLFGSRAGASNNNISINAADTIAIDFNNSNYSTYRLEGKYTINTKYILYNSKEKRIIYDENHNVLAQNTTICNDTITTSQTATLFYINPKPSNTWYIPNAKIYYCKIWNNGKLIRNFIPCMRNSDNEVGLYDTVGKQFYTNAGTGKFGYKGYTFIEYIESTGTQYINSNVNANDINYSFDIDFYGYSSQTQYFRIFGYQRDGGIILGSKFWYGNDTDINCTDILGTFNDERHSVFANKNYAIVDNVKYNLNTPPTSFIKNTFTKMAVFGSFDGGTGTIRNDSFSKIKLYNFKIYHNNNLIRNFIPAIRNSDNVAGLYDLANDTFYENAGTGTFITPTSQLSGTQSLNTSLLSSNLQEETNIDDIQEEPNLDDVNEIEEIEEPIEEEVS